MTSRSRKNMRSRRNKNSRRNRSRSHKSRKGSQRGGVILAPGAVSASCTLLPEGSMNALTQGAAFAAARVGQQGGAADIKSIGEPFISGSMSSAAMQDKLLNSLNQIKGMQDGGRRKSRKGSRRRRRASRKSRKGSKKARKGSRKSRKGSRRQRGGQADINASYMTNVEAKGTHPQFNKFTSL